MWISLNYKNVNKNMEVKIIFYQEYHLYKKIKICFLIYF